MSKRIAVIGLYGMSALFHLKKLPDIGETARSEGLIFEPGGKGYNQALAALRAGADIFFATAVGTDPYGRGADGVFQRDGILRYKCLVMQDAATAFAAVAGDAAGNNIVIVEQGACARVTPDMIQSLEGELADCEILLLQCEMPDAALLRALELGKRHGLYTILNPAPARLLPAGLLAMVDLLTPNWSEAVSIAGLSGSPEEVGRRLADMGCANVIITMGGNGAFVRPKGQRGYIQPAFQVPCVDSTGAGDNFNGALAARLLIGDCLQDGARYAAASSALSVTRRGVMDAIPTIEMVEAFLLLRQTNTGKNE